MIHVYKHKTSIYYVDCETGELYSIDDLYRWRENNLVAIYKDYSHYLDMPLCDDLTKLPPVKFLGYDIDLR